MDKLITLPILQLYDTLIKLYIIDTVEEKCKQYLQSQLTELN